LTTGVSQFKCLAVKNNDGKRIKGKDKDNTFEMIYAILVEDSQDVTD